MSRFLNRKGIKKVVLFIVSLVLSVSISILSAGASEVIEPANVFFYFEYPDGSPIFVTPSTDSSGNYYYLSSGGSSSKQFSRFCPLIHLPTDINLSNYSYVYYSFVMSTVGAVSYSFSGYEPFIHFLGGRASINISQIESVGGKFSCTFNEDKTIATVNYAIPVVDQNGNIPDWFCAYNIFKFTQPVSTGMQYVSLKNIVLSTDPFDLNTYNQLKEISQNTATIIEQQKANGATLEEINKSVAEGNQKLDDINKTLTESDIDKAPVTDLNNSINDYQGVEGDISDSVKKLFGTPVEINGETYNLNLGDNVFDTLKQVYDSSLNNFDLFSLKSSKYFRGTVSGFIGLFGVFVFFPLVLGLIGSLLGRYRE